MKNYFAHCPIQDLWENKKAPPICRSLACIAPLVKTDSGENGGGTDRFEAGELVRGQMVSFMHQRQSPLHRHDVQPSPPLPLLCCANVSSTDESTPIWFLVLARFLWCTHWVQIQVRWRAGTISSDVTINIASCEAPFVRHALWKTVPSQT